MAKIRTIVAGAAVVAALSIGVAAAPTQAATTAAASVTMQDAVSVRPLSPGTRVHVIPGQSFASGSTGPTGLTFCPLGQHG
ncbi:Spy/CpxP family protein refolding chaperone [Thermocatellispora tengchongensis]|uniref:Spy/CpxP family protein refolding chaperone n=1 Tax=Thermocatellispora tengchongensis TaxID=1073253 RepID=A0A840PK08_9ACTN|nr:Spy/CpxP family protein refolding chaperone [Thermocatellispora tengchongensis]